MVEEQRFSANASQVSVVDAQLDRLSWLLGATFDALERLEWTQGGTALQRFVGARIEVRVRALELPVAASVDGGLDLSRLPEGTRERATRLIQRAGGLFLGLIKQDVTLRAIDGGTE